MKRACLLVLMLCTILGAVPAWAAVTTKEETVDGKKQLVLENDLVRMVVLPDPGGTVVEFIHKPTGTNYVAGGDMVRKGRLGFGWKDYYWLESPQYKGAGVFTLPYQAEFRGGEGYKSIFVKCEIEGKRFEREMRLPDNSAELTTILKLTNIDQKPQRLQVRWHSYSTLDDQLAEHSCIIAPGPTPGEIRKCFIGSGYDHQFITSNGYWFAANYKTGSGMWMTFNKNESEMQITWTDYQFERKAPSRGYFIAEPYPNAILALPGECAQYTGTFYPVTADEAPSAIPLGVLKDPAEQESARQFLAMVKPNLPAIGPFSMTPGDPPAGQTGKPNENRFDFMHRRRDRLTLRPWGIMDAMMSTPNVQEQKIRTRYYARIFDDVQKPVKVSFRMNMVDAHGKVAQTQTKEFTIDPAAGHELDVRDDVPMTGLADGWYTIKLDGFVEGEKEPIHSYTESRRLIGNARPEYEKATAALAAAPLVERPFVAALRKMELPKVEKGKVAVPIGVEEGSGVARTAWPVRCGVPFAEGMLPKDAAFELIGPDGKAVLAQTAAMATWMDGSLRWVLVDFQADVPANGHVFYTLKNAAKAGESKPVVSGGKDEFTTPSGTFKADDAKLFGLFGPEDLWWEDSAGQKYYFRLKGENAGVVVEENGANRAVIKATGWYFNAKNRPVCMGELRMEYYRGQSFVKLHHTVTYCGDPWHEELGNYGLRLQVPNAGFTTATVELDGKAIEGKQLALFQQSSDGADATADGKTTSGVRSIGVVRFNGGAKAGLTVYHRNFWQMAPKKIDADAASGTLTLSYWPKEAGAMSFLPREDGWVPNSSNAEAVAVGMGRTQELIIDFGSKVAALDFEKVFNEPVVAITPPKYLASTKAMMHLSAYDPERQPKLERSISDTIDFYASQRELYGWYGQWFFGGIPNVYRPQEFRWLEFGRYAWILNEQDSAEAPWLCYMRSGDRKYLKFAESNTRHLLEVATIRWNPTWAQYVGLSRRHHECIWLGGGDTGHSMLDPFMDYYFATGYKPAWDAAERMAGGMAKVTGGAWRYISNPVAGLSRMYLHTQNPFYKENADRIWNSLCYPEQNDWWMIDHGDRMVMWYAQINPQCKELWAAWALNPEKKGRVNGMDILTARYLETGDAKFADAAAAMVPQQRPEGITQYVMSNLRAMCYTGNLPPNAGPKAGQKVEAVAAPAD